MASASTKGEEKQVISEVVSSLVTENMVKEEERLQGETDRVSASFEKHEFSGMKASQRYARLQHLLNKSGIYSKILLKKMEDQREENKKMLAKKSVGGRKRKKNQPVDNTATETVVKTRGKGRKRRNETESYQLSEFMDSKGKLRKRAKCDIPREGSKALVHVDSAIVEETEEERRFEGKIIPVGQPKLFSGGIMRPYQLEGTDWLKVLYENGVNGILADEMGLGKTIQCIALIAHLIEMGVRGPYLVVAPLSTVPNWVSEFKRFTPKIPVVLYHGTIDERDSLRRKIFSSSQRNHTTLLPVFVTSYEVVMKDYKNLAHKEWKLLIVDEGHRIKNLNCRLIKILKSYNAGNRLLLTGTPLQNNLAELWSLLNFILPDIFDDLDNFQSWFDFGSVVEDGEESTSDIIAKEKEGHILSTLHEILTPFLLRRLKSDVELLIPPKKEILVYAPLTPLQEKYYTGILNKSIEQLLEKNKQETLQEWGIISEIQEKENISGDDVKSVRKRSQVVKIFDDDEFEALLREGVDDMDTEPSHSKISDHSNRAVHCSVARLKMTCAWVMLRKCCNHPYLIDFPMLENGNLRIDEEIITSCGKMLLLDQMLTALLARGHKVLIFSQMTQLLDLLEDVMEMKEFRYARLDGSMRFDDRATEMLRFKESPDCNVFLLSTRAGGLGLNLTAADTVIIYDSDWNPQADLQAQDRCHRIGQTKPVVIYRFVTANTIDQRIVERARGKRRLEKMVIHKDKFKGSTRPNTNLSLEDLVDLLKSVDHDNVINTQQILSDSALEALLDRSFANKDKTNAEKKGKDKLSDRHSEFFTVVDEQQKTNDTLMGINSESSTSSEKPDAGKVLTVVDQQQKTSNALIDSIGESSTSSEMPDAEREGKLSDQHSEIIEVRQITNNTLSGINSEKPDDNDDATIVDHKAENN